MTAENATSRSTGNTMNQALLFQVLSMSVASHTPGIGINVDALRIELDMRLGWNLRLLADDHRDFLALEPCAHDPVASDILDLGDVDRHSLASEANIFGAYPELDRLRIGRRDRLRQLDTMLADM